MKKVLTTTCSIVGTMVLTLSASIAHAEWDYGVLVGASYSDNVERSATNEESSAAAVVGFDLRGVRTAGRLLYDVYADVEYQDYFEEDVESQEFGRLIAQGSYAFVPEAFEWMLSGSFDQIREELLRPIAPDNVEDVITLSTGPRLTGRFGDTFEAQLEGHYTIADYSEREGDSDTVGGVFTLGRSLSERTYLGIGAAYDDVTYDLSPGLVPPDYERREYFVRFNTTGGRTTFEADAGYAEVSGIGIEDDGPMARARLTRRLTPYVSAYLAYTLEFPTSADAAFTPEPVEGDLAADASILTPSPREVENAQVGIELARPRTSASLVYVQRSETTLGATVADRDYDEVFASFDRLITTRSSAGLYGSYTKEEIDAVTVIDADETAFGGRLMLAFGRALGLEVRVEHRERNSDVGVGEYKEFAGGIFLRYGTARRPGEEPAPVR